MRQKRRSRPLREPYQSEHDGYYDGFGRPREASGGIKARVQRGAATSNWWSKRWLQALNRLIDPGRLQRGRSYARKGQVLTLDEAEDGLVTASVQGSQPRPYKVTIRLRPLTDEQWQRVINALASQAAFAAHLLAGTMPEDIEQAFAAAGVSLFPDRDADLETDCSCPDFANPCKHIAAVYYLLADRFDEDPFMIFRLRGRTQDEVLAELRRLRTPEGSAPPDHEAETPEAPLPLDSDPSRFWALGLPLDSIALQLTPPVVELPLLKRLGDPPFVVHASLQEILAPAYRAISEAALAAAFAEPDAAIAASDAAPAESAGDREPGA